MRADTTYLRDGSALRDVTEASSTGSADGRGHGTTRTMLMSEAARSSYQRCDGTVVQGIIAVKVHSTSFRSQDTTLTVHIRDMHRMAYLWSQAQRMFRAAGFNGLAGPERGLPSIGSLDTVVEKWAGSCGAAARWVLFTCPAMLSLEVYAKADGRPLPTPILQDETQHIRAAGFILQGEATLPENERAAFRAAATGNAPSNASIRPDCLEAARILLARARTETRTESARP